MQNFSVFKRTRNNSTKWYAQFRDPETFEYMNGQSIESLKQKLGIIDNSKINKVMAIRIAQAAYDRGICFQDSAYRNTTLAEYVNQYWDFDLEGGHVQRKNSLTPNSMSKGHCIRMQGYFRNHCMQYLPKGIKVADLQSKHVEKLQDCLLDEMRQGKLASATYKKIMNSLACPVKELVRTEVLKTNPLKNIESITVRNTERGIPTKEETKIIEDFLEEYSERGPFEKKVSIMMLLAFSTGMREGEIRALTMDDITVMNPGEPCLLNVKHSYSEEMGIKSTKGKYSRIVPCPYWLVEEMRELSEANPYMNKFIFWGGCQSSPIDATSVRFHVNRIYCESLNITEQQRQQRSLCFHSLRHCFVTRTREILTDLQAMALVGHRDVSMLNHYTHAGMDQALEAGKKLFAVGQ